MSYNFDGKVVNRITTMRSWKNNICGCCSKIVPEPVASGARIANKYYCILSYVGTKYFIYESKCGRTVVYCSDYCRKKHNHRFTRKKRLPEEYEHSLIQRITKLENHIKKNLKVGDSVLDNLTGEVAKIDGIKNGKFRITSCAVPRNLWEISLVLY